MDSLLQQGAERHGLTQGPVNTPRLDHIHARLQDSLDPGMYSEVSCKNNLDHSIRILMRQGTSHESGNYKYFFSLKLNYKSMYVQFTGWG